MLRDWLTDHDFDHDDLLFRTLRGRRPTQSNWNRSLQRDARTAGHRWSLSAYDARHAAATTWLGAGVPLGEVALRLGHSVETLVSHYVGALHGDDQFANERIAQALAASPPPHSCPTNSGQTRATPVNTGQTPPGVSPGHAP